VTGFVKYEKRSTSSNLEVVVTTLHTETKGRTPDVYYSTRKPVFLGRTTGNVSK
jgi:hypothetical protein